MSAATQTLDTVQSVTQSGYKWGFETDIEMELAPKGLNEDIICLISARKKKPDGLLTWRLQAFAGWKTCPTQTCDGWVRFPAAELQKIRSYGAIPMYSWASEGSNTSPEFKAVAKDVRTRLAQELPDRGAAVAPRVARILGVELGWDERRPVLAPRRPTELRLTSYPTGSHIRLLRMQAPFLRACRCWRPIRVTRLLTVSSGMQACSERSLP